MPGSRLAKTFWPMVSRRRPKANVLALAEVQAAGLSGIEPESDGRTAQPCQFLTDGFVVDAPGDVEHGAAICQDAGLNSLDGGRNSPSGTGCKGGVASTVSVFRKVSGLKADMVSL